MPAPASVFGPEGLLATRFAGFEPRDGQVRMADAVTGALERRHHLAVEAPCGVGKSFAYLVPALEHAVRTQTRVVVCTANIALQEQLVARDLPALAKLLPFKFRWGLVKGINNYLCLDRWHEVDGQLALGDEAEPWARLQEWAASTRTGDQSELEFMPPESVWGRVNGVNELCNGPQCPDYEPCFAMNARRRLRDVDLIVTNYHLFFAHLRVKMAAERNVILPPFSAVVCDEAHNLADVARDFFGRRLSEHSIFTLVRGARLLGVPGDRMRSASRAFFEQVGAYRRRPRYRIRLRESGVADPTGLADAVKEFRVRIEEIAAAAPNEEWRDKAMKYQGAAAGYLENLGAFLALDDPNQVAWIETEPDRRTGAEAVRLVSRTIEVSGLLRDTLFKETPSVIMTSATLTSGTSFEFLKRETGGDEARELVVPTPFDFPRQARLVVPPMEAGPNDPGFGAEMAKSINRIVKTLGGRTLALFTSYKNMNLCADAAAETGVEILRQGVQPRSKLLEAFREDRGTALFATASFWEGIDVPGAALSCLIIDKIPFTTPEDPLLDALRERDPEHFAHHSLPRAIIALRQGFGRLIRTSTDRGVIVLFDKRIYTARYGQEILASLPEVPVRRELEAAFEFLGANAGDRRKEG
jgi:ATP-dependent DNA helicase DinG